MDNKVGKSQFFKQIFLIVEISINIVQKMPFLILRNVEINFLERKLNGRSYITVKAFLTTKQFELAGKKEFTAIALDLDNETFVVYIAFLTSTDVHPFCRVQIVLLM